MTKKNLYVQEKEIGYLGFKVPREYFDAFKMYRIAYHKKILNEYGDADTKSAFLYIFRYFCEKEGLDFIIKKMDEYEDRNLNIKKELRKIELEMRARQDV